MKSVRIRIALTEKRAEEFRQLKAVADQAGLETELIDNAAAQTALAGDEFRRSEGDSLVPFGRLHEALRRRQCLCVSNAASWASASPPTRPWKTFMPKNGRVTGVKTNRGAAACRYRHQCRGRQRLSHRQTRRPRIAHRSGAARIFRHRSPWQGMTPDLPCFRVPEHDALWSPREGGLLLGGWETEIDANRSALLRLAAPTAARRARLARAECISKNNSPAFFPKAPRREKTRVGRGWPTFTPDGRFIIGESSRVKGFVMAGGCNAHGISGSAGIGRLLVESIFEKKPSEYVGA